VNLLEIQKDQKENFILGEKLKVNFDNYKVIDLQNFEVFSHLFNEPIDDSINNFLTLFGFLLKNKDQLNFETLCILNKNLFENIEDLIVLMRLNYFSFVENDKKNENFTLYKIKDCYYREIDKNVLIKDLIDNNVIHEYPEFEIFNKRFLDSIL